VKQCQGKYKILLEGDVEQAFNKFDTDGSGYIDKEELK